MYPTNDYIPPAPVKKSNTNKYLAILISSVLTTNLIVGSLAFLYGRTISSYVTDSDVSKTDVLAVDDTTEIKPDEEVILTPTPVASSSSTLIKERSTIVSVDNSLSGNVQSASSSANIKKEILIGETPTGFARGFMTFDITKIPSQAKITSALLKFDVSSEKLPTLYGKLFVDHITYGSSLDASDYAVSAIVSNISQIKISKSGSEADITKAIANDVANSRDKSQIRIHYETEKRFASSGSSYLSIPKPSIYLEVKYN